METAPRIICFRAKNLKAIKRKSTINRVINFEYKACFQKDLTFRTSLTESGIDDQPLKARMRSVCPKLYFLLVRMSFSTIFLTVEMMGTRTQPRRGGEGADMMLSFNKWALSFEKVSLLIRGWRDDLGRRGECKCMP